VPLWGRTFVAADVQERTGSFERELIMTVYEVPKSYQYECDNCKCTHLQESASGHYANSTPPGWMTVRVVKNENAAPFESLLCGRCRRGVVIPGFSDPRPDEPVSTRSP
jgi:hypothetical protein